jgi:hypothetical protein
MSELWDIMQQHIFWLIIVFVILLLVGLVVQTKQQMRRTVDDEIYKHFPSIKKKIEEYELVLHNLQLHADECERRLREIGNRK